MRKILVIGTGGREHALAWKLAQEAEVFVSPGNPGISTVATLMPGTPLEAARAVQPDLVVIGPENPLIDGLADTLRGEGFAVFGPGASGAHLEGSKAFCKEVMTAAGVRTAGYRSFTNRTEAGAYAREKFESGRPVVVKASGAALGKGVVVCESLDEADEALDMMMIDREFGEAGTTIVIEDRLRGPEFSLLSVCNGREFVSLPVAQDYKRALDQDRGPNTGGMGTYSPVDSISSGLVMQTERDTVSPLIEELRNRRIDYRGVLFSGLMVDGGQPWCLEYNVRFGDPETETVMRRLGSGFAELLLAAARGEDLPALEVKSDAAVTVIMASGGYPGAYEKGVPIAIPHDLPEGVVVFHCGTAMRDGQLVTAGGRVLAVSATGESVQAARASAYAAADRIEFSGKHFRRDIALSS